MPERTGYCPVRDGPVQVFDGVDGVRDAARERVSTPWGARDRVSRADASLGAAARTEGSESRWLPDAVREPRRAAASPRRRRAEEGGGIVSALERTRASAAPRGREPPPPPAQVDVDFDLSYRTLTLTPCNSSNYTRMGYQWYATEGEGYSARVATIAALPDAYGGHAALAYGADESATVALEPEGCSAFDIACVAPTKLFEFYGDKTTRVRAYGYGALAMGSCGAKSEACNGRLPAAWDDVGRFLTSGFWEKRVVCAFCVDRGRFNRTVLNYALLQKGTVSERLVFTFTQPGPHARPFQAALFIQSGVVRLSWLDMGSWTTNTTVVGLSHGLTPRWEANA